MSQDLYYSSGFQSVVPEAAISIFTVFKNVCGQYLAWKLA